MAKRRKSAIESSPEWRTLFASLAAKAELDDRAVEAFAAYWGIEYDAELRELVRVARHGPH